MIWQNAWAFAGMAALAIPLLVHLLARRSARRQTFPTLRFLAATRLLSTRRTRLSDLLLLAVRLAVVALAVAALARPYVLTGERASTLARTLARVVVVDTSASMQRAAAGGGTALDAARQEAAAAATEAAEALIVETAAPARGLAGAAAWLEARAGRRDVVLISDFQAGSFTDRDMAALPAAVGVAIRRVDVAAPASATGIVRPYGEFATVARAEHSDGRTEAAWTRQPAAAALATEALLLLAPDGREDEAMAALRAALATGAPAHTDDERPVAIGFAGDPRLAAVLRDARAPDRAWMADVLARIADDDVLDAATGTARRPAAPYHGGMVPLPRAGTDEPVALAATASVAGRERLLLVAPDEPGGLASAALIAATLHALRPAPPVAEAETAVLADTVLARWQREPGAATAAAAGAGESDGRWLWLAALAVLALETWLRRGRHPARDGGDGRGD